MADEPSAKRRIPPCENETADNQQEAEAHVRTVGVGGAGSIGFGPVTVGYGPRRGGAGVTSRGTQQVVQGPSVEADGLRTRIRGHVLAFREDKGKLRGGRVKTS